MTKYNHTNKKRSKAKKIIIILGCLGLLSGFLFVGYFLYSYIHSWEPNLQNYQSAKNNQNFKIEERSGYYSILPEQSKAKDGLIIYQGAFADARAYIAPYSSLTQSGITVFIVRSPFNFALFGINTASKIISENPSISDWYIGGHSLGGVAACEYAKSNYEKIKGLILLASFCNGDANNLKTKVISISGTKDGFSTAEKINASRPKLPDDSVFIVINGANHTQFADLEKLQPGDNNAEIESSVATSKINDAIINFIR